MINVSDRITVEQVEIGLLKAANYNPRKWSEEAIKGLSESIKEFGLIDPIIVNKATNRLNVVIGGHFRLKVARDLGFKEIPAVYVNIPDIEKEKELNLRLNKNVGEWVWDLLAKFDESFLSNIGFSSEDLDSIFNIDTPESFDLEKELNKLNITKIDAKKGDIYMLGGHCIMVGDSTIESDVLKLMNGEKANLCMTDPPYILDYLNGKKKHGKAVTGFGAKRDRRYLETDVLPTNFTDLWMDNIAKIQKPDFSIMVFENPKNLRTIWNTLEKHWKYRNTIIWHLPNRMSGFAAKYKFFNKYDFAMIGTSGDLTLNDKPEDKPLFQEEYDSALFATSGKPTWESYKKGKKYCPTDFIEFKASDEKSSGQGIIFGTKPTEVLIPYIKVLTKRDDIVVEPFCGSGSTMISCEKLGRRCYSMEKSPVYTMVAIHRWEKLTGKKAIKLK
jgi:DNA modification methylase